MTTDPTTPSLSPAGRARRNEILSRAQRALRARVRRRIIANTALGGLVIALGAGALVLARVQPSPTSRPVALHNSGFPADAPPSPVAIASRIQLIPRDPAILRRTAIVPSAPRTEYLDDRGLADALTRAGLPAGVIRTPDRVTIAPIVRSASLPPAAPGGDPGALPAAPTG